MAFSFNPFARGPKKDKTPVSDSPVPRNPTYNVFKGVSNDIERIVA